MRNSLIFGHLTEHYSFLEQEAISALRASHKRLHISRQKSAGDGTIKDVDDTSTKVNNDGTLLEMALDWLSLHLSESDLRPTYSLKVMTMARMMTNMVITRRNLTMPSVTMTSISIQMHWELTPRMTIEASRKEKTTTRLTRTE